MNETRIDFLQEQMRASVFGHSFLTAKGDSVPFESFKGSVLLITNVASE